MKGVIDKSDDIRLIRRRSGGWLAVSPFGASLQIGVTAETIDGAKEAFADSAKAWRECLAEATT